MHYACSKYYYTNTDYYLMKEVTQSAKAGMNGEPLSHLFCVKVVEGCSTVLANNGSYSGMA